MLYEQKNHITNTMFENQSRSFILQHWKRMNFRAKNQHYIYNFVHFLWKTSNEIFWVILKHFAYMWKMGSLEE